MSTASRDAGVAALKAGDAAGAIQHLEQAVQENPQDGSAHGYLGAAYGQAQQFDKAAASLSEAVRLSPNSAALRFNLGTSLERAGKQTEAVDAYRKALELDGAYERARQALVRLGQSAPAGAAEAAPKPAGGGMLGDFVLPGSTPSQPAPSAAVAPPPPAWNPAPAPGAATVSQPAPSVYGAAPPAYGAPPPMPGNGSATISQDATMFAPPSGLQPLGDWSPPAQDGGLANYQTAPAPPPQNPYGPPPQSPYGSPMDSGAVVARAENPGRQMPESEKMGHGYLAGIGMGAWWGLIGAAVIFIGAMCTIKASELGQWMPVTLVACLMMISLGCLMFGVIGLFGAKSDDAEVLCANLATVVGVITALFIMPVFLAILGFMGISSIVGTIFISRLMGKSLGGNINEMQASIFVVTHGGSVAVTPMRR
jgi:hypothetical protein